MIPTCECVSGIDTRSRRIGAVEEKYATLGLIEGHCKLTLLEPHVGEKH